MWAHDSEETDIPPRAIPGGRAAGLTAMILSSVLFSVMSLLIRLAAGADAFQTSFTRFAVGAAVVASLAITGRIRLQFSNIPLLLLRGVLGAIGVYGYFLSIDALGIARGSVISYAYPLFAAAGGAIFLKERVRPVGWAALAAAVIGLVLMRWDAMRAGAGAGGSTTIPYAIAVVGALAAGLAIVCVRRLTTTDSPPVIFLAQCLAGFWLTLVPAASRPAPGGLLIALLLLAIGLSAAGAQLLMAWSFVRVDVATGSLLAMITPVINVAIGVAAFGESFGPVEAAGAAVVLIACTVLVLRPHPTALEAS